MAKDTNTTPISCATCKYEHKGICAEPCMDCDPRRNSPNCRWEANKNHGENKKNS